MKDVLTALTSEVFKPLMTVFLPGAVSLSALVVGLLQRFDGLRKLVEAHSLETAIILALLALLMGEVIEDLGSRIEYGLDCCRKKQRKNGVLEYPDFAADWERYLRFADKNEPVAIRYIRTLVIRLKFELGMFCALILCGIGIWATQLSFWWGIGSDLLLLLWSGYFLWEANDTHELLAETRKRLFGLKNALGEAQEQTAPVSA